MRSETQEMTGLSQNPLRDKKIRAKKGVWVLSYGTH